MSSMVCCYLWQLAGIQQRKKKRKDHSSCCPGVKNTQSATLLFQIYGHRLKVLNKCKENEKNSRKHLSGFSVLKETQDSGDCISNAEIQMKLVENIQCPQMTEWTKHSAASLLAH